MSESQANPFSQRTAAGVALLGLAAVTPISVLSATNSSRFSYRAFLTDDRSVAAAREALSTYRWQSHAVSAVMGMMSFAATESSFWGIAAAAAGSIVTELLHADMKVVIDEQEQLVRGGKVANGRLAANGSVM